MQITDLIRYNNVVRASYLEAMTKLPWQEVIASRGLSFDSMRDVFLHLTLVEDRWINYIIPSRFHEWVDPDFNVFQDVASLANYMRQVHAKTEVYLSKLDDAELTRLILVPWGEKPYPKLSVETVLTHLVMEDMVHYGELSAAFWQMGLDAPYRAYWRYKHQNP